MTTIATPPPSSAASSARPREVRDLIETVQLRAAAEGSSSPGTLFGYAAVYDRYSEDLGYFREKIAPGAFDKAVLRCDVRALVNHDVNLILGRTSAGTLRLRGDDTGLLMEVDLPDTSAGRDVAESIRRRDVVGQSFSFTTAIDQWDFSGEVAIRTLIEIDELFDVGPVAFPAYSDTSVAMRAYQAHREAPAARPDPAGAALAAALAAFARQNDLIRLRLLEIS